MCTECILGIHLFTSRFRLLLCRLRSDSEYFNHDIRISLVSLATHFAIEVRTTNTNRNKKWLRMKFQRMWINVMCANFNVNSSKGFNKNAMKSNALLFYVSPHTHNLNRVNSGLFKMYKFRTVSIYRTFDALVYRLCY